MTDSPYPADGPTKPEYLSPCNGCGLCCVASACAIALDFVPGARIGMPCPALEWQDGRSWCGMVRNPAKHAPELRERMLAGLGAGYAPDTFAALNQKLGAMIRDDLGGDSGCDSAPADGRNDDEVGMTAAEYHAMAIRPTEEESSLAESVMRLFR